MKVGYGAMFLSWIVALFLATTVVVLVSFLGQNQLNARLSDLSVDFEKSDAVFLGTSLTRFALPDHGNGKPLPEINAKTVFRAGLSNGNERELLALAELALRAELATVFIEINPIISRLAHKPPTCKSESILAIKREELRHAADAIFLGRDILRGATKPADNERLRIVDLKRAAEDYPLAFVGPCYLDAWEDLIAASESTQIIMVVMPRAEITRELVGVEDMATFSARAKEFSTLNGIPLFEPDALGTWGDDLFVGRAHMSPAGSNRFLQELSGWWLNQK